MTSQELRGSKLQPAEAEIFRHGLWLLLKESSDSSNAPLQCDRTLCTCAFPVIVDYIHYQVTGQVRINSERAIAEGPFSVVFLGTYSGLRCLHFLVFFIHPPRSTVG